MIRALSLTENKIQFRAKKENNEDVQTELQPETIKTKLNRDTQKIMSAFVDYPIKGLTGDINADFYEFLSMGTIPYVIGSIMFMSVFNITKHLDAKGHKTAGDFGRRMAMGVLLYALFKSLSKNLVVTPIKWATGVNTEMPYQNKVCDLPQGKNEDADVSVHLQQRTVFDSKEFFRKDLLERDYYDNIAKKVGLGENLNDSITEVSPIIQNIVASSNLAKSITKYCWAGVGVGLATQDAWSDFFARLAKNKKYISKPNETFISKVGGKTRAILENLYENSLALVKAFFKSFKQMWNGKPNSSGISKHAGKSFISVAAGATVLLTANTILRAKNLAKNKNINTIDNRIASEEI